MPDTDVEKAEGVENPSHQATMMLFPALHPDPTEIVSGRFRGLSGGLDRARHIVGQVHGREQFSDGCFEGPKPANARKVAPQLSPILPDEGNINAQ